MKSPFHQTASIVAGESSGERNATSRAFEAQGDLAIDNAGMRGKTEAISANIDLVSQLLDDSIHGDSGGFHRGVGSHLRADAAVTLLRGRLPGMSGDKVRRGSGCQRRTRVFSLVASAPNLYHWPVHFVSPRSSGFSKYWLLAALFHLAKAACAAAAGEPVEYVEIIAKQRNVSATDGLMITGTEVLATPATFKPPVEITAVAMTDSQNLRLGYAADFLIENKGSVDVKWRPPGQAEMGEIPAKLLKH